MSDTLCGQVPPFAWQMQEEARKQAIPISGTFELTPRCNFNCRMCYVHLADDRVAQFGEEMPVSEWIRLAEEARAAGMLYLCITGGDPLIWPGFEEFYRAVSQMGFFITLQTNASLLSPRLRRLFDEYPPYLAKITVYGSNDDVYRDVCCVEHGFTRADAGIRTLKELGIPVFLVTTVIRQNKDDLENIARYAQSLDCPWIYSSAVHPSVRGAATEAEAVAIREEDADDYRDTIREMLTLPPRKENDKPCDYCKGHRTDFSVSWDGKLRFCNLMSEPDIPVRGRPLTAAWRELVDYEEALRWPEECYSCEIKSICRVCAGTIATRSGSIKKVDRTYCDKMKQYVKEEKERMKNA